MKKTKPIFHLLMHIGRLMNTTMTEVLVHLNLHHAQGRTLVVLLRNGETTQANLARGMDIKPATVTNMLKPLEKRGLISRQTDPVTNRAIIVKLTEEGADLAQEVFKCWDEVESKLQSSLISVNSENILAQLEAFRDTLGGAEPNFEQVTILGRS